MNRQTKQSKPESKSSLFMFVCLFLGCTDQGSICSGDGASVGF